MNTRKKKKLSIRWIENANTYTELQRPLVESMHKISQYLS